MVYTFLRIYTICIPSFAALSLFNKNVECLIRGNKWYRTALVATETIAYQGRESNKTMGVARGGGGCYQTQREGNRWELPIGERERKGGKEDVTGAQVNWAHAPFLHLRPQLPVPSSSLSTTFVSAGASIIKITSSLFIRSVVEQLRLASSPMEDGVSVQGTATEGAEGVSTPHYLLRTAHGAARCPNRHSRQLSAMFHLNRWV